MKQIDLFRIFLIALFLASCSVSLPAQTYEVVTFCNPSQSDTLNRAPYSIAPKWTDYMIPRMNLLGSWLFANHYSQHLPVYRDINRWVPYEFDKIRQGLNPESAMEVDFEKIIPPDVLRKANARGMSYRALLDSLHPKGVRVPPKNFEWSLGFIEEWTVSDKIEIVPTFIILEASDPGELFLSWRFVFPYQPDHLPLEHIKLTTGLGGTEEFHVERAIKEHYFQYSIAGVRKKGDEEWAGDQKWISGKKRTYAGPDCQIDSLSRVWPLKAHFEAKTAQAHAAKVQTKGLCRFLVPRDLQYSLGKYGAGQDFSDNAILFDQVIDTLTNDIKNNRVRAWVAKGLQTYPIPGLSPLMDPMSTHCAIHGYDNGNDDWDDDGWDSDFRTVQYATDSEEDEEVPWKKNWPRDRENYGRRVELVGKIIKEGKKVRFETTHIVLVWVDPGMTLDDRDFVAVPVERLHYEVNGKPISEFFAKADFVEILLRVNNSVVRSLPEAKFYSDLLFSGRWDEFPHPKSNQVPGR